MYELVKEKLQQQSLEKRYEGYKLEGDGLLTYKKKVYIPNVAELRRVVMDEIHQAPYSGQPGYQKTIATAKKQYFWLGMKKDMAEYISRCMKCQQVKVEHHTLQVCCSLCQFQNGNGKLFPWILLQDCQ